MPDRALSTRARVREVFAGYGFRRVFRARAISQLGDGLFQFGAAAVLIFENPGENPVLQLLGIISVTLVPFSLIAPFTGVFIDRWERSRILFWVPVGRALIAALLPFAGSGSAAFYIVVLVVLSANRFFLATMSAVLPQVVPEDDLLVANSVATTGGAIANVVGQGAAALLAGALTGENVAFFASAAFAASAVAARRIPVHRGMTPLRAPLSQELREVFGEMTEGIRTVARNRRVAFGLSAIGVMQFLVGAMTGVLVYFFIKILGLEVQDAFEILVFLALGIGVGVVLVPTVARKIRRDRLVVASFALAATGCTIAAPALSRVTLIIGAAVVGTSYAFAKIPVDTIVQEEMADVVRGRAFAVYDMLFNLARVAGVAVVALAYEFGASSTATLGGVALGYALAAASFARYERRIDMPIWKRRSRPAATATFEAGELVTVRSYEGSRADEEPRVIVSGGREIPITAIDWRAVVEEGGRRARVFVVRAGGQRVRLAHREDGGWEIERIMPLPAEPI